MSKQSKVRRTSLAILTAGTLSFSSTYANANENDTETFETVDFQDVSKEQPDTIMNDEAVMGSVQEKRKSLDDVKESPSLLPGDFFYFAKVVLEKIQLAFTADDVKEAKLLAGFAAERLSEALALLEEGEEEKAIEMIEKALQGIEDADKDVDEPAELEAEEDRQKDEVTENAGQGEEAESDDTLVELEEIMARNIIALKAAMEKVKNPTAKAALKKNIGKSYAKLAEKIAESAEIKEDEELGLEEEPEAVTEPETVETEVTEEASEEPAVEEEDTAAVDSTEETQASIPVPSVKKAEKEQKKAQQKQEKAQQKADKEKNKAEREMERERLKAEREAEKEKIKANHGAQKEKVRAEWEKQKAERKAAKEAGKKEDKENKGKGHGNKENKGNKGNGNH
ncbi:DUF5667 domain-containing protein [Rossellomorea vietnamensis]|uniref:DUF5667 domain-containing protein n=1 Tax=Rossellomorea vietnamensis TaxID=218284 RepID=UPI003CF7441A